jgi:hypothetical protein
MVVLFNFMGVNSFLDKGYLNAFNGEDFICFAGSFNTPFVSYLIKFFALNDAVSANFHLESSSPRAACVRASFTVHGSLALGLGTARPTTSWRVWVMVSPPSG